MNLGKIRHNIDVSSEYYSLAKKDENVAILLKNNGEYRHSIYFFIQAMEKYIRAKIFTLVNPNIEYFRERNRSHSLDDAIIFLIDIISTDDNVKQQVNKYFNDYVFENIKFNKLHNNLRYPHYSAKYNSYSNLDFNWNDCDFIEKKLFILKNYLDQLQRL